MFFYKYRSFKDEHLNAIIDNKIWFARGDTFNDPFDSKLPLNILSYESMAALVKKVHQSTILTDSQFQNLVVKQLDEANQMLKEGTIEEHPIWPYLNIVKQRVARRFILCLTQCNTSVLMWSHYSSTHTGFCVRYNLEVLLNALKIAHHGEVTYSNEIPDVLLSMIDDIPTDISKDILFQKSEDWIYEKEYRLILDDFAENKGDKLREVGHPENAVERIYFGLNTTEFSRESLIDHLSDRQIEFFQMGLANSTIGVFPKKLQYPGP